MSDMEKDATRSPVRGQDGDIGAELDSMHRDKQCTQKHTTPAVESAQMSRSSSEASTSSSLSSDDEKLLNKTVAPKERVSIYVQVFEEMLNTVLEYESHLFDEDELEMLARFKTMSYPARYLFVRLFSRKNGWFRVSRIGYHDELVDVQAAVDEICETTATDLKGPSSPQTDVAVTAPEAGPSGTSRIGRHSNSSQEKIEDSGIILIDSDLEEDNVSRANRKSRKTVKTWAQNLVDPLSDRSVKEVKKEVQDFGLTRFAINERILAERHDIDELLGLLSLDELKALGKELRIPSNFTTRQTIIDTIKRTSTNQSTLKSMFAAAAAKTKAKAESLLGLTSIDGKSYKGKGKERKDPTSVSLTRQTEVLVYKILQHLGRCIKLESGPIRLFARLHLLYYRSVTYSEKTLTQAVLARFKIRNYPSYKVKRSFGIFENRQALVDYEDALIVERRIEELTGEAVGPHGSFRKGSKEQREADMREALSIFEQIYPKWQEMVSLAKMKDEIDKEDRQAKGIEDDKLTYYRKRFLAGWPLTRVVYKGATILAKLHEYNREAEVMATLLEQNCFRRGKRGEWYDRLALLYMHHHAKLDHSDGMDKVAYQEKALKLCYEGLNHPWSHLIYHNTLARRIVRLETALDVPKEERHPPVPNLRAATQRTMKGEKLSEGETGRKSVWRAQDGSEVSVEELCLEQYKREGWKGFHSENGILTTIFALLFWDVIFAPIDGVFETAYQAGPLDLSTDAFAIVRAELVQDRLKQIEEGQALELLRAVDMRERENKTYCVGLKWAYERDDLLEIIQCFTPQALRTVCRVYAEEWSHRIGGVPDLFLWNFENKCCRFVEVKGPGDFLSETQKVWIDVLLSAGVSVERCSVRQIFEEDYLSLSDIDSPRKSKKSPPRKRTKQSLHKRDSVISDADLMPDKKRHRPSPPLECKAKINDKKQNSRKCVDTADHEELERIDPVSSARVKCKIIKSKKTGIAKRSRRPAPVSKTSGSTIVLSD